MAPHFRPALFAAEIEPMPALGERGHARTPVSFDPQQGDAIFAALMAQ